VISNGTNALNLAKTGASTQVLTGQNTYTGSTTVTGGNLEIGNGGSLRGTSSLAVNSGATVRISTSTNNVISSTNPTTYPTVNLGGSGTGTIELSSTLSSNSQRFGALTVSAGGGAVLGFGTGNTNSLVFTSLTGSANGVAVRNWTGTPYLLSATAANLTDATQDRLLFVSTPGFAANTAQSQFSFTNDSGVLIGRGLQVTNGAQFEIVPTADTAAYWNGNIDATWNAGTATNTNWWTTAAGTTVATLPGPGTNVFMTANSAANFSNTTLEQDFRINSLTFTGTGTSNTGGATVASGSTPRTLTLDASGGNGLTVAAGSGANTVSTNVALGANQTWTNNSGNVLTVSGGVSGSNRNLTVATSTGGGDVILSGAVTTGTGTLTKDGAGILSLTGSTPNTFTGQTTVNAGELRLGKTGVNAIGGNLSVTGGTATLTGTGGDQIANTGSVSVSGGTLDVADQNETVAGVQLASGSIVGTTGVLTSTSNFDMQSGTASAILGGNVGLNKSTAGTVTLSGTNTYTGATTINAGRRHPRHHGHDGHR
jgi:autotransporter-associated beta strand protein